MELGSDIPPLGHFWDVLSILHLQVSGDKNEEQVLNAIEAYTEHRPEITSRAINLLFDIARIERCNQLLRALEHLLGWEREGYANCTLVAAEAAKKRGGHLTAL